MVVDILATILLTKMKSGLRAGGFGGKINFLEKQIISILKYN